MIEIPTLETERLIFRAPKLEDLEAMEVFFFRSREDEILRRNNQTW